MLRTRSLEFYNRGYAAYIYIYIYIHVDLHMSAAVFGWKVASSKQVVGMANRSKQTISLVKLKEIGKEFLPDPNTDYYLSDDVNVVVSYHCKFFKAVALHTKRLNPVSLSQLGKDLFKLQKRESEQYGDSLASAFSYCMTAGSKAVTGSKLSPNVLSVYKAAGKDGQVKKDGVKAEVKEEGLSSKRESSSPPPRPSKTLKPCLSSPSQIASLYACRSVHVKAIPHADTPRRHSKQKWPPHICIYIYMQYTHLLEALPSASFVFPIYKKIQSRRSQRRRMSRQCRRWSPWAHCMLSPAQAMTRSYQRHTQPGVIEKNASLIYVLVFTFRGGTSKCLLQLSFLKKIHSRSSNRRSLRR